jgi:peroxiredoxin
MSVEVGESAPEFELKNQHGETVRLSDYHGKQAVVLVFFPFAFSRICTGELCEIRDNLALFRDADVEVIGISCDPMYTLRAFGEHESYDFPLLADFWPHGAVAAAYGVFNETAGRAERGTFLIDKDGDLRWAVVNAAGEARPMAAYRDAIAAL